MEHVSSDGDLVTFRLNSQPLATAAERQVKLEPGKPTHYCGCTRETATSCQCVPNGLSRD